MPARSSRIRKGKVNADSLGQPLTTRRTCIHTYIPRRVHASRRAMRKRSDASRYARIGQSRNVVFRQSVEAERKRGETRRRDLAGRDFYEERKTRGFVCIYTRTSIIMLNDNACHAAVKATRWNEFTCAYGCIRFPRFSSPFNSIHAVSHVARFYQRARYYHIVIIISRYNLVRYEIEIDAKNRCDAWRDTCTSRACILRRGKILENYGYFGIRPSLEYLSRARDAIVSFPVDARKRGKNPRLNSTEIWKRCAVWTASRPSRAASLHGETMADEWKSVLSKILSSCASRLRRMNDD